MASWFEFLRIEADLPMSFIAAARNHSNPANSARSLGNARKALAEIQRGLIKPTAHGLSEDEVLFLEQRRTEVESALEMSLSRTLPATIAPSVPEFDTIWRSGSSQARFTMATPICSSVRSPVAGVRS